MSYETSCQYCYSCHNYSDIRDISYDDHGWICNTCSRDRDLKEKQDRIAILESTLRIIYGLLNSGFSFKLELSLNVIESVLDIKVPEKVN